MTEDNILKSLQADHNEFRREELILLVGVALSWRRETYLLFCFPPQETFWKEKFISVVVGFFPWIWP